MTDQPFAQTPIQHKHRRDHDFVMTVIIALLLSFGVTMLVFSLVYLGDLRTLQDLPGIVWAFVCGVPKDDQVTLPILVLISAVSFAGALGLWGWRRMSHQ